MGGDFNAGGIDWETGLVPDVGTWKSAFSVPPFSALVTVCMYNGCQKHTSENCGFHRLIYYVFHIFI